MKLKQIKITLLMLCLAIFSSVSFVIVGIGQGTAMAYVCTDPSNTSNNPLTGNQWEYHDSDGMCWKVRYTQRTGSDAPKPPAPTVTNGTLSCPNGGTATAGSNHNQCAVSCPSGDVYHSDTNTCWYKNGYTEQDTQKIAPTHNDGTAISGNDASCSGNFTYIESGGSDGPGCYAKASDGTYPCGPDQSVTGSRASQNGGYDCKDTGVKHLIPKDTSQSSDTTVAPNATNSHCTQTNQTPDPKTGLCPDGTQAILNDSTSTAEGPSGSVTKSDEQCGQARVNLLACGTEGGNVALNNVLRIIIMVLSILVGIAAVGGLAYASVQYAKAEDDAGKVKEARTLIRNIVIGILLYGFLIAIVGWLIPGSVIG